MSRTFNSRHDFLKKFDDYEFPNGFSGPFGSASPGEIKDYDYSHTTDGCNSNERYTSVRHPNKRKKRGSLGREFTKTGMQGTRYWRNRYGEEHDKSSRSHLVKREMSHTRRHRLKNDTEEIVNNSFNEMQNFTNL